MAQNETWLKHDLMKAVRVQYLDGNLFSMDNAGNLIGVTLTRDGEDYAGGGSVSANVIRADGGTVTVTGALSGNAATVVLPQAAYVVPGAVSIVVKLTASGQVTTIAAIVANVYRSSTDTPIDPGTIIPSVQALISAIDTAVASIPADYSSLWASLAPAFSSSTAYTAGQYVTYNGGLYRFTADHAAGAWNSAHVVAVNICGELSDLKSAITVEVPSTNLYNKSQAIDGYLIYDNLSEGNISLGAYADAVLSGFVPVQEGKTYTIYNGSDLWSGNLYFVSANEDGTSYSGVCARKMSSGNIGNWPGITGFVEMSGRPAETTTFKIIANSGITHIIWFIRKANVSSNYYGSHTGITDIVKNVQLNEGSVVLPFEEYGVKLFVPSSAVFGLNGNIDHFNTEIANLDTRVSAIEESETNGLVSLQKSGNDIFVVSRLNGTTRMEVECSLNGSQNGSFNLQAYRTIDNSGTKTAFKGADDDICPLFFGGGYIGANHGYAYQRKLVASGHGLTETNIGEIWTDNAGNSVTILSVPSASVINVACYDANSMETAYMKSLSAITSITKNGATINVSDTTTSSEKQIRPSINNISCHIYRSNGAEIIDNGFYGDEYFDIVESYNIWYPPAMFNYLHSNVGSNTNASIGNDSIDRYCTVRNTYRFTERGAITVFSCVDFKYACDFNFYGITQSGAIGDYYIVPNSTADSLTLQGSNSYTVTPTKWRDANNPPDRFYQFAQNDLTKGMVLGYNTAFGDGKATAQKLMDSVGFYNGASHKVYPKVADKHENKTAGFSVSGVAYRIPLVAYDPDIPCVSWYYVNDDIYLLIEAHSTADKIIDLPAYMNGRTVEIIEAFGTISIPAGFIAGNGMRISVTDYGSAVVKLSK